MRNMLARVVVVRNEQNEPVVDRCLTVDYLAVDEHSIFRVSSPLRSRAHSFSSPFGRIDKRMR